MIRLQNVSKWFGSVQVLDKLSFEVPEGSITAFLGPNGAGKTTTMRLLFGYYTADSGSVRVSGLDPARSGLFVRAQLGYLPENGPIYPDMTVREFLELSGSMCSLRGSKLRDSVARVVRDCDLTEALRRPLGQLSKGYRQRAGLARALIHDPRLLVLDEPTTGLDPNQVREILMLIKSLAGKKTVLLSTHILHHVPELCDRVLLLHRGRIRFEGAPADLLKSTQTKSLDEAFARLTQED